MHEGSEDVLNGLLSYHRDLLTKSAISSEVVRGRGYRSIGKAEASELGFTGVQARSGLLIPLWRVDGSQYGYQLRPDEPRTVKGKLVKYETPKSQTNLLDVPPTIREELSKGRQAILITEGARKADALASLGIPCIDIAGVYGWRGKNVDDGLTALGDWETVNIKGNIFVLAFDSDILSKSEVHQALGRLKRFLEGRGALKVRVLVLPQLLSGKTGVDDYLAETGATASDLAKLVVDGIPASPSPDQDAPSESVGPVVDLAKLLNDVCNFVRRYVVLSSQQVDAIVMWTAHSHAFKAAETTPYLSARSAEKRSGKTRLLEVLENLVPSSLKTENISVAALVHSVDKGATLLLDEVDSVFGKGKSSETQEVLRGILDSGYRMTGSYVRMTGQGSAQEVRRFKTFSPKALAGIGGLPGTIDDRSIIITLKRKAPHEPVERLRWRDAREQSAPLYKSLEQWAPGAVDLLRDARPDIPQELDERAADCWEPLLAIADMAGEDWPKRARDAAKTLSAGEEREEDSLGVRLLGDIRKGFNEKKTDKLFTSELLPYLNDIEESPWGGFGDGGMTGRDLARYLKRYGITSKQIRIGESSFKGYDRDSFLDAWTRYCPLSNEKGETSETPKLSPTYEGRETMPLGVAMAPADVSDNSQIQPSHDVSLVSDKSPEKGEKVVVGEL